MEKYFVTLTKEELNCLKCALSIAHFKLNHSAEHDCNWKGSIMKDVYKKEATKMKKLLDELNDLK